MEEEEKVEPKFQPDFQLNPPLVKTKWYRQVLVEAPEWLDSCWHLRCKLKLDLNSIYLYPLFSIRPSIKIDFKQIKKLSYTEVLNWVAIIETESKIYRIFFEISFNLLEFVGRIRLSDKFTETIEQLGEVRQVNYTYRLGD